MQEMKQYITRLVEIDLGHREMDERFKCYSIHGHRVKIELNFQFTAQDPIGYRIDFKEIKRVGGQWLEDMLDHGFAANPHDTVVIDACHKTSSKLYLMSLNGIDNYCNPTAENLSREIFLAMQILFSDFPNLKIYHIRFYETPNCWVDTYEKSISEEETKNFFDYRYKDIKSYAKEKGKLEYDTRKLKGNKSG